MLSTRIRADASSSSIRRSSSRPPMPGRFRSSSDKVRPILALTQQGITASRRLRNPHICGGCQQIAQIRNGRSRGRPPAGSSFGSVHVLRYCGDIQTRQPATSASPLPVATVPERRENRPSPSRARACRSGRAAGSVRVCHPPAMPMPSSVTSTRMPSAPSCAMVTCDLRRLSVADRIAHAFLHDAIDRLFEIVVDPIILDSDHDRECDVGRRLRQNVTSRSMAVSSPTLCSGRRRPGSPGHDVGSANRFVDRSRMHRNVDVAIGRRPGARSSPPSCRPRTAAVRSRRAGPARDRRVPPPATSAAARSVAGSAPRPWRAAGS